MSAIAVEGVTRRFGRLTAVDSMSLSVEPGQIVGLLGANGAGKTTVMRMVLGLLAPTEGRISVLDRPVDHRVRRSMGYVPQGLGLYGDLTVAENLAFVAAAYGVATPTLEPALAAVADRRVGTLPLGLRRRTAFAAARCHRPEVLILDEPTSGVEPLGRAGLWETIHEAADGGAGVLVSTHHLEEAEECHRVVVMSEGRSVMSGPVVELIAGRTSVVVDFLDPDERERLRAAGLVVLVDGARWRVADTGLARVAEVLGSSEGLREVGASFEEAFVGLGR